MMPGSINPAPTDLIIAMTPHSASRAAKLHLIGAAQRLAQAWKSAGLGRSPEVDFEEHLTQVRSCLGLTPPGLASLPGMQFVQPELGSAIQFAEVYDDSFLVIVLMRMPKGFKYQYHDHQDMMVLTKVIEGDLSINYFDLEEPDSFYALTPKVGDLAWATAKIGVRLGQGELTELYPRSRNIHSFEANQDTVILDVLLNYYDDNRPCNYYSVVGGEGGQRLRLRVDRQE